MELLYVYGNCSPRKYKQLFEHSNAMILQQAQKYHSLVTEGLKKNGVNVKCISGLPINRNYTKKLVVKREYEKSNDIEYQYYGTINLPVFRQLGIFFNSFFYTLRFAHIKKYTQKAIVCDILNISNVYGAFLAARLCNVKTFAIVTDVPGYFAFTPKLKGYKKFVNVLKDKINTWVLNSFEGFVFLTEEMNALINTKNKPYIVVEGQVDSEMSIVSNELINKRNPKTIVYAGTLNKIYGIRTFVEAFISLNLLNYELWIYGDGDFKNELIQICNEYDNVKYRGVKLNDEIVAEEIRASILVNPRPTKEEYTKYSFPSKNMEYMASGTPVLTTKLPGMPNDYIPYVFLIEDESFEGYKKAIAKVTALSPGELHKKGSSAKQFVTKEKSNIVQAQKIANMIKKELSAIV